MPIRKIIVLSTIFASLHAAESYPLVSAPPSKVFACQTNRSQKREPNDQNFAKLRENSQFLTFFLRNLAPQFGINPDSIKLRIVREAGCISCDTQSQTIYLSWHYLQNYDVEDTTIDFQIDNLPDNPEKIRTYLLQLSPSHFKRLADIFPDVLSAIELEAVMAHELGHIALGHMTPLRDTPSNAYKRELDADLFACATKNLQKGLIRELKRSIIDEILNNGQAFYDNIDTAVEHQNSHPSNDLRLKQALSIVPGSWSLEKTKQKYLKNL